MRKTFAFSGVTELLLNLDAAEFIGLDVAEIEALIRSMLRNCGPSILFSEDEISHAAAELYEEAEAEIAFQIDCALLDVLSMEDFVVDDCIPGHIAD